jgi:hypothetical protein
MYKIKNWVFADAGHHLKMGNNVAYFFEDNKDAIEEVVTTIDDMHIVGDVILWSNNKLAQAIIKGGAYGEYKKAIIQKKYSNDDQIAIILNKDSGEDVDLFAYNKMQEWRQWASIVAKKIVSLNNQGNE